MAYDEQVAARIRALVAQEDGLGEMEMFGGLAFLIDGNMAVGVMSQGGLMVLVAKEDTQDLLRTTSARPFEMRGRPTRGWLRVDAADVESDDDLAVWVGRGVAHARSLPPKPGSGAR